MSILITLITSEWFWTAVIVPFVLYLLSRIGANYKADTVKKAMDILYQIVVFAISLAETESKKGNIRGGKKDFVIQYVKNNSPDWIKKAIPNFEGVVSMIIEGILIENKEKFNFNLFK